MKFLWCSILLSLAVTLIGCRGLPKNTGVSSQEKIGVQDFIKTNGEVKNLKAELKLLQSQVSNQKNLYDLSANQLKEREVLYKKQQDLYKGFIFFLMGMCVVFAFAPAFDSKWSTIGMLATLSLVMVGIIIWLFKI